MLLIVSFAEFNDEATHFSQNYLLYLAQLLILNPNDFLHSPTKSLSFY
jgi:hypothetical protein